MLNVLLQNLMRIEHFEICILKLIKKLISRKLADQLNGNYVCSLFAKCIKIMKIWKLIWQSESLTKLSPSVPYATVGLDAQNLLNYCSAVSFQLCKIYPGLRRFGLTIDYALSL